jgi:RNA polymerase sigma-70 factor, ECF subfamily
MNESVLYIEDEEDYQILVGRILQRAGYPVRMASTGEEGLAMLRTERPSLLLLDINLPDTDGYTICQQLRQDGAYSDLPILMLTVRRRPEEWLKGFSCGANDYLSKPFDPAGLLERLRAGFSGKTLSGSNANAPEYLLIQAAVAGNRAAFEVLIQKYRERLIESLRQNIGGIADEEDVAAHAFLCAFETLKNFRGESSFYTWLYRIALNEATDRKRDSVSLEEMTQNDDLPLPTSLTLPDELPLRLLEKEDTERMRVALKKVPEPYRRMLDLYFLRERSYGDIARQLKIPLGTVMSRLHKARGLFKTAWAEFGL